MKFRSGMLGITVVMVALAGALLGAWALSTDVESKTITVYNELTDITPLFGTDNAPTYTNYNPSTNYTGYYTDDSTVGSTKYFDGVDYDRSSRANTYKLNLKYTSSSANIYSLEDTASSSDFTLGVIYWPSSNSMQTISNVPHLSILELIEEISLGSYTKVQFKNVTDPEYDTSGSFITFATASAMSGTSNRTIYMKNPSLTGDLDRGLGMTRPASETEDPISSAVYDSTTGLVTLYYGNDYTDSVGIFDPSQVYILWSGTPGLFSNFTFNDALTYNAQMFPQATYMNPSKGVELE